MAPRFFLTDVFTTRKYGGNQLATFVDCDRVTDGEMQRIAREINFSETTFILGRTPRNGGFDDRIFTPTAEVPFAGHPTLGTAHVIRKHILRADVEDIALNLPIGQIPVRFDAGESAPPMLWMRQTAPTFGATLDRAVVAGMLGLAASALDAHLPIAEVSTGFAHIVVPLSGLDALRRATVDRARYDALVNTAWAKVVLVFSREPYEPSHALSVRVFAPFFGISEDAATGSGNGALAAYLSRHRVLGSPTVDCIAGQGYEMDRPSTLALRTHERTGEIEVSVGGRVVDVAEGVWN